MDLTLPDILGYVLGAVALLAGLGVVTRRDAVVAAMNLVLAFFCLSGIYLLLGFPFLATLQILVYAGAIMVLFLFVIMLLGVTTLARTTIGVPTGLGAVIGLAVAAEGGVLATHMAAKNAAGAGSGMTESVEGVASLLFRDAFVLPFEIAGVLLLAAMVGVVVLARRDLTVRGLAEFAREHAFDPRPLVSSRPDAAAPDGIGTGSLAHAEAPANGTTNGAASAGASQPASHSPGTLAATAQTTAGVH